MRKLILLMIAIAIAFPIIASAGELTDSEVKRELIFDVTLAMDYAQTKDIKNHPGHYEKNSVIGKNPSDKTITVYFIAAGAAHAAIAKQLPTEYRAAWQYGWIAAEVITIIHNRRAGMQFSF